MLLASLFRGRLLYLFSPCFLLLNSAEVNISWRHGVQRLVIPFVVAVGHKLADGAAKLPREVEGLQFHHVLHRTVVAFNLPLRHGWYGAPRVCCSRYCLRYSFRAWERKAGPLLESNLGRCLTFTCILVQINGQIKVVYTLIK